MRVSYSDSDEQMQVQAVPTKEKPVIKLKQWLHSFKPNNSQNIKSHVLSFLLSEGLYDVAKIFSQEAGIPMVNVDEKAVKQRYQIKNLIRTGQIDKALQMIKKIDPAFQKDPKNYELLFTIKCLKVINLIKTGNIKESIQEARINLLPFTKLGEKFVKQTQKVMGLLAFVNLKDCPNQGLTKQQHCSKVASRVNKHILNVRQQQNDHALQSLLKLGKWCQKRLSQYINFPTINLQSQNDIFKEPT